MRWMVLTTAVCGFACFAISEARGQFIAPEGSTFHNGSTLPLDADDSSVGLLRRLEQALATSNFDEVVSVIASLRARPGGDLVQLGPRTHVQVLDKALRLVLERAPEEVRSRIEADTRKLVAEAVRFRDLNGLLSLATRGHVLDASAVAALGAARLLFEQGRWWEALSLAQRAGELEGASELARAAEARIPSEPGRRHSGPWVRRFAFQRPLDPLSEALPFVVDGRPGEILLQDSWSLHGMDLRNSLSQLELTFESLLWGPAVLGAESSVRASPAPRQLTHERLGSRIVTPWNLPDDSREPFRRSIPTDRSARLIAVDLVDDKPVLAWQARGPDVPESTAFGPVTIEGDRVFVQLFRIGIDTEVSLLAFRLSDGAMLFETPLVRGSFIPRFASRQATLDVDELDKRAREGAVAVQDGLVYACTGFGVVAAVDGVTGAVRFTFRYDRTFSLDRSAFDAAFLFDTGGWSHEPVRIRDGRVVVAPSDSRFLYMLAPEPGPRGHVILEDPIERADRVDIVGLLPSLSEGGQEGAGPPDVLLSRLRDNRSSLVRLSAEGSLLESSWVLPPGELQSGRPLMLERRVVMPTMAGLRIFDVDSLDREAELLPQPEGLPAVRALYATEAGLVGLCPVPDAGWMDEAVMHVVYWQGLP
jgi:hypothetical protein